MTDEQRISHWLLKSEPQKYSFEDLLRDRRTIWDGVRNAQAAIYLRAMKCGDRAFFYHSVKGLEVVGIVEVVRESFADPGDPSGRFVAVEVAPVGPLPTPVPLSAMKQNAALAGMAMFRQFRLSVSPVSEIEWRTICALGGVAA